MNFYETMYIIHPALQAGRLDDMISSVHKKIESLKGKRLYFDNWGKKKLAYAIDKQKYGTYVLIQFSMDGSSLQDLSNEFEHNANILRYLTNRIDESDILEQKDDMPVLNESPEQNQSSNSSKDVSKIESSKEEKDQVVQESSEVTDNDVVEETDSPKEDGDHENKESKKTEE